MRIALMTNNYKPFMGGVPISIERLKNGLERQGHEVTVFAPTYQNQVEEKGVFRYRTLLPKIIGGIVLPNPFDAGIEREFQKNQYDIIHVHHPMLIGDTAVYLSQKYRIPLVFTYHTRYEQYMFSYVKLIEKLDSISHKGIQSKLFPMYLNRFFKNCHHIFAPTIGMKNYLQEYCGLGSSKISVLPTGMEEAAYHVKEEEICRLRKQYDAEDIPLFLSVSRMANEKNVAFLLRSIAKAKEGLAKEKSEDTRETEDIKFKVIMVGDGPDRKTYEKQCIALGIEKEVVFTGQIPNAEISPYFAAADAFLFASKTETQGIVILEAFAGKTPVCAVKASGVEDLVRDGWNGRLCEDDVDAFARNILGVMEGKERWEYFSQNAYKTALDYKEDAVAQKAVQQYNRVIANFAEHKVYRSGRSNLHMVQKCISQGMISLQKLR